MFGSEQATGHRNRAIAYMMLNFGMIERDPNEVLDLYFRQCSVNVTCRDLAIMAATLANDGTNPLTGEAVFDIQYVRDMLSVMNSCGMYDYAGEWAYEVGMPAKSGVSGCIIAVIPGQIGICVFSPPIDQQGNSVRGIRVCQEISNEFELHAFNNRTNVRSVIRRDYRADLVRSNRLRTPEERKILAEKGGKIAVLEAQGPLFFGSAEQLLRRLTQLAAEARYVVVDFKRVHLADTAARKLIVRAARAMAGGGDRAAVRLDGRRRAARRASPRPWPNATTSISCACSATPTRRSNGARTGCSRTARQGATGPNSRSRRSTCSRA